MDSPWCAGLSYPVKSYSPLWEVCFRQLGTTDKQQAGLGPYGNACNVITHVFCVGKSKQTKPDVMDPGGILYVSLPQPYIYLPFSYTYKREEDPVTNRVLRHIL